MAKHVRLAASLTALALLVVPAIAAPPPAPAKASVTGEIVDSACYIKMGAKGESHRDCAQKCGDAGIPLALLEDGSDKVIWLASVNDMETPNKKLREHAGRKVTITGTWAERGGARILLVETVQPVKR